jgi:8-oxo-dGTP pyrophosphatase MutT (NUDIX family)
MWWNRLRGSLEYRAWQAQQHPDILFGAGIFVLSTVGAGLSYLSPGAARGLFVANLLVILWGLRSLVQSGVDRRVLAASYDDWAQFQADPPGAELREGTIRGEAALVWPGIDLTLWHSGSRLERLARFRLDAQGRAVALPALRHHRVGAAVLFNDAKVRLASTLTPERLDAGAAVAIQRTDYFSTLVTNDLTGRKVVRAQQNRDVAYDGRSFFVSGRTVLPHETSRCSDHIGFSVHAITLDGMLISTLQAPRSGHNPGRFAPAGSGSMDWDEVGDPAADRKFIDLVAAAMRREVHEECGCALEDVTLPLITGYARLLHRGGKPEFLGLCVVRVASRELAVRRSERAFVDGHRLDPIDHASVRAFLDSFADVSHELAGQQALQWTLATDAVARHSHTGLVGQFLGDLAAAPDG